MRLLTGPAGSGKTRLILEEFRAALRAATPVRLLVPTATLAQHLQNQIAREGLVYRRGTIQTLSGFVRQLTPDVRETPDAVLFLVVEEAARRVARPEFARVRDLPGFCATVKRVIEEFASAGCDSARLASVLPSAPLAEAFLAVYQKVDRELARRGLVLRAQRLRIAADRVEYAGTVLLDGFRALPGPEIGFVAALGRSAAVTLALGDDDLTEGLRSRLEAAGFVEERLARTRTTPVRALFVAPSMEREVQEIARRILEQAAAGRPFREMGIIVRSPDLYAPLLATTLERFGIPARFLFDSDLDRHPAIRFLTGAIDAMLAGWDHEQTLGVLRLAPRFADSAAMDRLDFDVRAQMPGKGLPRPAFAERLIQELESMEEWRPLEMTPAKWAARLAGRIALFRPAPPRDAATHAMALEWRSQSKALDLFAEALEEAATALDAQRAVRLDIYWRAVKAVLRVKPLRLTDGRRDVVQVLSAHEARQWNLPVVFVPGMVEKQFPRFQQQDPFFPDAARCRLHADGIRVRTAAEFDREERALFDSAVTRATLLATLSYPEFDAKGERTLPSLFLESLILDRQPSRAVRPKPSRPLARFGPGQIGEPALLKWLSEKSIRFSPTGLETFLQCEFQYFATKTLRLKTAPLPPKERLDFLTEGNIVHGVLAEWWKDGGDITAVFERVFAEYVAKIGIQPGYHTERNRNSMLDNLLRFAGEDKWPRGGFISQTEIPFEFALAEGVTVAGRIDRLDVSPDGSAFVIDYKYSRDKTVKDKLKSENLMQPALYLMAAESQQNVRPAGMFYIGLKGGLVYPGWSDTPFMNAAAIPENWLAGTRTRTLEIVDQIRSGRAAVLPADPAKCRFCDAVDVCRVDLRAAAMEEEAESA